MSFSSKPPVRETPDGRCALRAARKSFCAICAYQMGCFYLERELATAGAPAPVGAAAE